MKTMKDASLIVDRELSAVPLTRVLDVRAQLRCGGTIQPPVTPSAERPIIDGAAQLEANKVYGSSNDPSIAYYLPQYALALDGNSKPVVRLRYAGTETEVGRLTIKLAWTPPAGDARQLRCMDHIAALTLRYRIAPQNASGEMGIDKEVALQPLQIDGPNSATSTTSFDDKALFDSVYLAMRSPAAGATLDIAIRARVGVRTWRQVLVSPATLDDQARVLKRGVLFTDMVDRSQVQQVRAPMDASHLRVATSAPAKRAEIAPVAMDRSMALRSTRMRTVRKGAMQNAATMQLADARVTATPANAMAMRADMNVAALARMNAPSLMEVRATSDMRVGEARVVPTRIALDHHRRPAVVDAELEHRQTLPFGFDPSNAANDSVYEVGDAVSAAIHLLLPLNLIAPDGSSKLAYQDNLMPDVVYLLPDEFRLDREPITPYLPGLSFVAREFTTTESDTSAELLFRVDMVYRLEPWTDPQTIELARAALKDRVPRFSSCLPRRATLRFNEEHKLAAQDVEIDSVRGIVDSLELDHAAFMQLWRERFSNPAAGGLSGHVQYGLFDATQATTPLRLSLWSDSTEFFDVSFAGPIADQPGRYRVLVRNRIESPVRIVALPGVSVAADASAHATNAESHLAQLLAPQAIREIIYEVTPQATAVTSLMPIIVGRPELNLAALLKELLVTPGYSTLGFAVKVAAVQGVFDAAAGGAEPVTALMVEFDDGTRATVSSGQPEVEVKLIGRLSDQLLGTADDQQRFFYRVTNVHASGEGARTSWMEGRGGVPLSVGAAIVKLDF
jgi:hypothetical protein